MTATTITNSIPMDAVQRRSFREVWVISVGHALTHWYPATFYILLPLIGNELGLDYAQIGSILTCQYAAGAIANVPGGIYVDTVGRKGLLMAISLCWIGIPYLIMGASHTYWMILVCATLVGIGNNIWHPTAIPWLGDRFPDRKGLVMSFHGMGANVGDAVAPLVVGWLLAILQLAQRRRHERDPRHRRCRELSSFMSDACKWPTSAPASSKPDPTRFRAPSGCACSENCCATGRS